MDAGPRRPLILYGAPASLYTAKVRAALRGRRLPYVERFPSDPRYRHVVRPRVNSHRIPVLEFDDGAIVQDSTVILDEIERRWPDPRQQAMGPRQRWLVHLMELVAERGLTKPAMHFRWSFPETNQAFLVGEFGRSLRFPGPPEEIERLGRMVADKMAAYLPRLGIDSRTGAAIAEAYLRSLALLDAHLARHPYLLGDAPCRADYALMGPLYGHLGRDPYPLQAMQRCAPLVFRWTERINGMELATPEFPDRPVRLMQDDAVPESLKVWLGHLLEGLIPELLASAERLGAWADAHPGARAGEPLDPRADQPGLGEIEIDYYGTRVRQDAQAHPLWLLQRLLDHTAALPHQDRMFCEALADELGAGGLLTTRLAVRLARADNRLVLDADPA